MKLLPLIAFVLAACAAPHKPAVDIHKSIFFNDDALLDDTSAVSLARLMATVAPDNHGGRLFAAWFRRFATTAHSERAIPAQWVNDISQAQGDDPSLWDMSTIPFKVTGIHNRIDLADFRGGAHCGELRVSLSSTHPLYQPFHLLLVFRQPLLDGDRDGKTLTCEATAKQWATLSALTGTAWDSARRALLAERLVRGNWVMIESVEFTIAPWEWRQWIPVPDASGALPFVLDNQPLFQAVAIDAINADESLREDFITFVNANAAALDQRQVLFPERFRLPSIHVTQGVVRTPLDISSARSAVLKAHPQLRQNIEVTGCAVCHTADAEFIQTKSDRTISAFYEKELPARVSFLQNLAVGIHPQPPYGPLQEKPLLPP